MANVTSPITSYSDTTPHKRIITDLISLIDPTDAPMIDALGGLDGAAGKFRFTGEGTLMEWLEDTMLAIATSLDESASITSTIVTMKVADGSILQEGQIIAVDTELAWISGVDTNTITVTRGVAGGTAATHTSTAAVLVVGMARLEGDDSDDIGFTDKTVNSNYTSIFHQEVKATRNARKLVQYGVDDEMRYQEDKVVPSLMRLIERMAFYSKAAAAGTATTARIFGGLQAFISTNKVSGATLAQSAFENAILSCYNAGGTGPWKAICAPVNMQKIKNWYDDKTAALQIQRTETTVGMVITRIVTPFGDVDLVMDRWAPTTIIPIIDEKHAGFKTYEPFYSEPLAKTGDADKNEVIGEFSMCIRQNAAHALLTNVS